ncbi:nuclear factor NF-kappa-B p105 subunit-like isoform X2 [Daphnia pulex]|uniref:nuclear factor NF-kappa-B p105 subunit-like isoform X2 n=1 Tax=Daphnia pulex TaxID=6669 RepID=UPI001EDF666D|nr:nuclear factor NF-kappa-B p105 subunit-like isoform X2 [Daphnia pulex]XP_046440833.1 nuclear factor NF-kappa-B p105 subunit-like isoform X2 [Daphnia pulex]
MPKLLQRKLSYDVYLIEQYLQYSLSSTVIRPGRPSPCLFILNQPQGKFRFRYASEMTGTHGCLMAESKEWNKKQNIRVQLEGCPDREAIIRCTFVTNTSIPVPHAHRLGGKENSNKDNGNEGEYQEIVVSAKNEWTATFSGLIIIHTLKKQVPEVILRRLINEMGNAPINRNQRQQLKDEADKIANTMDLHSVKLKFEAFVEQNGFREQICPPQYSQAIHNLKSTHAGDLRIVRIDKVCGCCTGQEEIFIFVEKVNKKDIKIRFFETDENEQEIWHAFADFSELDVHHQFAIAFKTPAYQDPNIQSDVTVQFQLYRPSNQSTSEAKSFTYTPRERVGAKRPYPDRPSTSPNIVKDIGQADWNIFEEFFNFDTYGSDASGSTIDALTPQLKHMKISPKKSPFSDLKPHKINQLVSSPVTTSKLMSAYSMNMARAIRWYATTGDLSHILTRMRHLMAMQSEDGDNALHDALIHNQTDVVRAILHAASFHNTELNFINAQNNANLTPLHISVLKNQTEATALLLQSGANPGLVDANGNTPIHLAAMDKHLIDCLQLLLNTSNWKPAHALKLNTINYAGLTPLHIAVNAMNVKSVELLLAKGADVNCHETKRGRSVLHIAVKKQSEEMVALLLSCTSLNVNMQSYDGMTALHLAVLDELDQICSLLIKSGADPSILNYVNSSASSENEECDENDPEHLLGDGSVEKGQSSLDLAQCNLTIAKVLRDGTHSSTSLAPCETNFLVMDEDERKSTASDATSNSRVLDSGIDLMTSKELPKELDKRIISDLANILDSPNKEWEQLADSLDLLLSMRTVLDKQQSPTTYLLSNMDLWEVSTQVVLEKLHFLKFTDAATLLENYLAT